MSLKACLICSSGMLSCVREYDVTSAQKTKVFSEQTSAPSGGRSTQLLYFLSAGPANEQRISQQHNTEALPPPLKKRVFFPESKMQFVKFVSYIGRVSETNLRVFGDFSVLLFTTPAGAGAGNGYGSGTGGGGCWLVLHRSSCSCSCRWWRRPRSRIRFAAVFPHLAKFWASLRFFSTFCDFFVICNFSLQILTGF